MRYLLVAVLLLLPGTAWGQTIRGLVREDVSRDPIGGATLELIAADATVRATAISDSAGWFQLPAGKAGRYTLRATHPSYRASGVDTVSVEAHEIVTVVVRMGRAAIPLQPLEVTARSRDRLSAYRERLERRGMGRFIEKEEIRRWSAGRPTDVLQLTPGVRVERMGRGISASNAILMRGGTGYCRANIYIDGMPIRQDAGGGVDDMITVDMLEGVEIYSSYVSAPAEFMAPMNNCGVVAFWTDPTRGRPFSWKRLALVALVAGGLLLVALVR